jgi:hypothetical protein
MKTFWNLVRLKQRRDISPSPSTESLLKPLQWGLSKAFFESTDGSTEATTKNTITPDLKIQAENIEPSAPEDQKTTHAHSTPRDPAQPRQDVLSWLLDPQPPSRFAELMSYMDKDRARQLYNEEFAKIQTEAGHGHNRGHST